MLNYIWLALVLLSVVLGGATGHLDDVTKGAYDGARTAVMTVALPLVGTIAVWLGIMRLADRSGLVQALAKGLRPLMRWLFPDVPGDHPAMGAMVMNIAANMLGLGNAATPLGPAGHGRPGAAQPPSRHRHQRDVHLPGDQHEQRAVDPRRRPLPSWRPTARKTRRPSWARRFSATSCACLAGNHGGQDPGKTAVFRRPRADPPRRS